MLQPHHHACFIEAAEVFLPTAAGAVGFFPSLTQAFGAGAFEPDGHRFAQLIQHCDAEAVSVFEREWDRLQRELTEIVDDVGVILVPGPLTQTKYDAGRGFAPKLQRQITVQRETKAARELRRDVLRLPLRDERRVAYFESGPLSTQFVAT